MEETWQPPVNHASDYLDCKRMSFGVSERPKRAGYSMVAFSTSDATGFSSFANTLSRSAPLLTESAATRHVVEDDNLCVVIDLKQVPIGLVEVS